MEPFSKRRKYGESAENAERGVGPQTNTIGKSIKPKLGRTSGEGMMERAR